MRSEQKESLSCNACGRPLPSPEEIFWECECGIAVCKDPNCFEESFKLLADGEATRCLGCGLVI